MKKKLIVFMICIFILPVSLMAEKATYLDFIEYNNKNTVVRAVLLPGWGQFFNNQDTKGYIIAGGSLFFLVSSMYYGFEADKAYEKYEKAGLINDTSNDLYSDYESKNNLTQISTYTIALLWIYGIVDSYIVAKKTTLDGKKNDGIRLACNNGKDLKLIFTKHF
ncbi:hypothetical protein ACFL58_00565 [Elusimicrobiota bacterium]